MDLEKLIIYIQKQIDKIEIEIEESTNATEEFEKIKNLLYSEDVNIEEVISIIGSKNFAAYSESILKILNNIKIFKDLVNVIETDLENIDIESFEWNLPDKTELFSDLNKLKSLYRFAINPNFKDEELKKSVFSLKDRVLDRLHSEIDKNKLELKKIIESIEIKVTKKNRTNRENIELLEKLKIYLDICNKNKVITTEEELKEFFEFIKQSNLSKDTIYRLIIDFTKSNITYYNTLIRNNLSSSKLTVKKNTENVHKQLKKLAEQELEAVEDISQEQLDQLNEKEKKIYDQVQKLLENYNYDDTFYQLYKNDYSLDARIEYYGTEEVIDFSCIKSDFVYILKPNLFGENKEKIFIIFDYILKLNEKHLSYQEKVRINEAKIEEEKKNITEKIQDIGKKIEPVLRKYKHEIEDLNTNDKQKNLCKEIYRLSKEGNEDARLIADGLKKPVQYFELLYIINEINELYGYVNGNTLELNELIYMYEELKKLISECELILDKLPKEKIEDENYKYDGINFVCFMNEEIDYSDENKKNEILKSIKNLKNYEWADIVSNRPKNHLWNDLKYRLASGKETDYKDELFSVGRMWSTGSYRTGLVVIKNINPENKEKIKKRYNLEKVGVIAFIIGVIYVEADHSQYNEFVRFVNDGTNRATIDYYVDLFMDPNTPEEKLFEILDKGIIDCKEINPDQPGIGGAVYE